MAAILRGCAAVPEVEVRGILPAHVADLVVGSMAVGEVAVAEARVVAVAVDRVILKDRWPQMRRSLQRFSAETLSSTRSW